MLAERTLAVVVEGGREVDRHAGREGTKAGVEVVVIVIYQFHRNHAAADQAADLLMPASVAANAIAGKQGIAAEQGVAGPLEIDSLGNVLIRESVGRQPRFVVRHLA